MSDDKPAMSGDREMKLLNCPFCGGFASTTEGGKRWWVGCVGTKCRCQLGCDYLANGRPDHDFDTEAEAIAAWNTRAPASGGGEYRIVDCEDMMISGFKTICDDEGPIAYAGAHDAQRIVAALSAAPSDAAGMREFPEGWQLVPKEPDWQQRVAGRNAIISDKMEDDLAEDISTDEAASAYRAMLEAAPLPSAPQTEERE